MVFTNLSGTLSSIPALKSTPKFESIEVWHCSNAFDRKTCHSMTCDLARYLKTSYDKQSRAIRFTGYLEVLEYSTLEYNINGYCQWYELVPEYTVPLYV